MKAGFHLKHLFSRLPFCPHLLPLSSLQSPFSLLDTFEDRQAFSRSQVCSSSPFNFLLSLSGCLSIFWFLIKYHSLSYSYLQITTTGLFLSSAPVVWVAYNCLQSIQKKASSTRLGLPGVHPASLIPRKALITQKVSKNIY